VRTILACTILFVGACSGPQGADYIPRAHQGWEYQYDLGYVLASGAVQKGTLVTRVEGDTIVAGKSYQRAVTASTIPGLGYTEYSRRTPQGLYEIDTTAAVGTEVLVIPLPLTVGRSWEATVGHTRTTSHVEGVERVALLERTYEDCLRVSSTVRSHGELSSVTMWLAKGVGAVKTVIVVHGVTIEITLRRLRR
jgi:hypothetical protein